MFLAEKLQAAVGRQIDRPGGGALKNTTAAIVDEVNFWGV
jgi:hypothetical protein